MAGSRDCGFPWSGCPLFGVQHDVRFDFGGSCQFLQRPQLVDWSGSKTPDNGEFPCGWQLGSSVRLSPGSLFLRASEVSFPVLSFLGHAGGMLGSSCLVAGC